MTESQRRRARQTVLIWIDTNVEQKKSDRRNILNELCELVDEVNLINTLEKCIKILEQLDQSKCFLITSGTLGPDIVPKIHSIRHLESIFIFCENETFHEIWTKEWDKILGVHSQIGPICDALRSIVKQVHNDGIAMSMIETVDNKQGDLKQLQPSFMYSSILKDVFLDMKFQEEHRQNMIEMLLERYADNKKETGLINEFSESYRAERAIWWYTRECFIYKDVNQSLRDLDGAMIVDMAPYIVDLHSQIKRLYEEQQKTLDTQSLTVYRGQGMIEEEFNKLQGSKQGLLSFNCFLSTSQMRHESLKFAQLGAKRSGHVGILFVIRVDTSLRAVPYADIREHSYFKSELEILFAMHSIFKIGRIDKLSSESVIYQVELHLTDENDQKQLELKKCMTNQYVGIPEHRLGQILLDMGENKKAEDIYVNLLKATNDERDKGVFNHQLGLAKDGQGKYEQALEYYQKAVAIYKRSLPEHDPALAKAYNCIGQVYYSMEDFANALEYYERDIAIKEKILSGNCRDLASSYGCIGLVYHSMREYSKAVKYHEKSLKIYKETLPENHPDIATSYHSLAALLYDMKEYKEALKYFEDARRIRMISLPQTHHSIKTTDDWIEKLKRLI